MSPGTDSIAGSFFDLESRLLLGEDFKGDVK